MTFVISLFLKDEETTTTLFFICANLYLVAV